MRNRVTNLAASLCSSPLNTPKNFKIRMDRQDSFVSTYKSPPRSLPRLRRQPIQLMGVTRLWSNPASQALMSVLATLVLLNCGLEPIPAICDDCPHQTPLREVIPQSPETMQFQITATGRNANHNPPRWRTLTRTVGE